MQVNEQHVVQSGAVTQEMAQYINALLQDNQNKNMRIESLMKETQAQAEILRPWCPKLNLKHHFFVRGSDVTVFPILAAVARFM